MNIRKTVTQIITATDDADIPINLTASAVNVIQSITVFVQSVNLSNADYFQMYTDSILFYVASPPDMVVGTTTVITRDQQIITPSSSILMNFGGTVTGSINTTVYVTVSYFSIPNSNLLSNNFRSTTGVIESTTPTTILSGPSTGCYVIKGLWVTDQLQNGTSYTLYLNQNSVSTPIGPAVTTSSGTKYSYYLGGNHEFNIALTNGVNLQINQDVVNPPSVYYLSYTYDPLNT